MAGIYKSLPAPGHVEGVLYSRGYRDLVYVNKSRSDKGPVLVYDAVDRQGSVCRLSIGRIRGDEVEIVRSAKSNPGASVEFVVDIHPPRNASQVMNSQFPNRVLTDIYLAGDRAVRAGWAKSFSVRNTTEGRKRVKAICFQLGEGTLALERDALFRLVSTAGEILGEVGKAPEWSSSRLKSLKKTSKAVPFDVEADGAERAQARVKQKRQPRELFSKAYIREKGMSRRNPRPGRRDSRSYNFYVILYGEIDSGWEDLSDAESRRAEVAAERSVPTSIGQVGRLLGDKVKVVDRAFLATKDIDPKDDDSWFPVPSRKTSKRAAKKNSAKLDIYDPREEQLRAQRQAIYETNVIRDYGYKPQGFFRNEDGIRFDVWVTKGDFAALKPLISKYMFAMGTGVQARDSRIYSGTQTPTLKTIRESEARFQGDVDHLLDNRQAYEESLAIARKSGFYRVVPEYTSSGLKYFVWPMRPGQRIPLAQNTVRAAESTAEFANSGLNPMKTGKWWKPSERLATAQELRNWLPPAEVFSATFDLAQGLDPARDSASKKRGSR